MDNVNQEGKEPFLKQHSFEQGRNRNLLLCFVLSALVATLPTAATKATQRFYCYLY